MSITIIDQSAEAGSDVVPSTGADGADYVVTVTTFLRATDPFGSVFDLGGRNHDVTIAGSIWGPIAARLGGDASATGLRLNVEATGQIVAANYGALVNGVGAEVTNAGLIHGRLGALFFGYEGAVLSNTGVIRGNDASGENVFGAIEAEESFTIVNKGHILAGDTAIYGGSLFDENSAGASRIENSGVIHAGDTAIELMYFSGALALENTGTIIADRGYSFRGHAEEDTVVNRGLMRGEVALGWGDDVFDNFDGVLRRGSVDGGDDDDRFVAGFGAESFDGGDGVDTVDLRGTTGVTVSLLQPAANTGRAKGDAYLNVERVWGSGAGADRLTGDGQANTLVGFGGDDTLAGGGGADRLVGGAGFDRLTGGAGADLFMFHGPAQGADAIADFAAGDRIGIWAPGFGGGLVAGAAVTAAQFAAQDSAEAGTAAVRFIFRTTDATLWYDANGNGAGGLHLVADLQAGASLQASDLALL